MDDSRLKLQENGTQQKDRDAAQEADRKLAWETPRMEDVSEQVTAQPYIRFT